MRAPYIRLLMFFLVFSTVAFADDIVFLSPAKGEPVASQMKIQISPPADNSVIITLWIEMEVEGAKDKIVWNGNLTSKDNFSVNIDTSKWQNGKYELNAMYFLNDMKFDGDMDIWINRTKKK